MDQGAKQTATKRGLYFESVTVVGDGASAAANLSGAE
jgi:hypothetical protein